MLFQIFIAYNFSVFMIMDRQTYLFYFNSAFLWTIFRKVIRTIYWAFGLSDNQSFGLLTLRTIGLSDYWAFRRLGLRTIGPSDCWPFGLSDRHQLKLSIQQSNMLPWSPEQYDTAHSLQKYCQKPDKNLPTVVFSLRKLV